MNCGWLNRVLAHALVQGDCFLDTNLQAHVNLSRFHVEEIEFDASKPVARIWTSR